LSSFPVGGVLAAVLSGFLLPDWRLMFLVAGISAILPLLIVVVFFEESPVWVDHRASRSDTDKPVSVAYVLSGRLRRTTILGTAMAGLALTGYWGASTWLPTYLTAERGLDKGSVATFMAVLNVGMFVGYNVFGVIADRLGRRTAIIISLLGVAVTLPVYAVTSDQTALLWLGPAFAFFTAFFGLFGSYLGELFPTHARATGAGFCFNVGRGISAFAPFALAGLASSIGFSGGLIVCAVFFGLSSVVALFLPRTGYAEAETRSRYAAESTTPALDH
jgi:MFS family permease